MNKILIVAEFFLLVVLFFLLLQYLHRFSYPNYLLSNKKIAGMSFEKVSALLDDPSLQEIDLKIKDRIYRYTYNNIGLYFDKNATLERIFHDNNQPILRRISLFIRSFFSKKKIYPKLIFSSDFYDFAQKTEFDVAGIDDSISIDNSQKKIIYYQNEEKYRVNSQSLKSKIYFNFGEKNLIVEPELIRVVDEKKKLTVDDYNRRLTLLFSNNVEVISEDNLDSKVTLSSQDIKKIIDIDYDLGKQKLLVQINEKGFDTLWEKLSILNSADKKIDVEVFKLDLLSLVESRLAEVKSDTILVKPQVSSNTNGKLADKYLEIDLSQQMMYLFENQRRKGSYRISSGLYYPTPTGQFKILNKSTNAYSRIFHVWMPYWMAFSYSNKLHAFFGIHELPYYLSRGGQKITRPRDFIGSPHTGGCVSLDVGEAQKVYNFAHINMPVYIFD